jgi:hypothetical protein
MKGVTLEAGLRPQRLLMPFSTVAQSLSPLVDTWCKGRYNVSGLKRQEHNERPRSFKEYTYASH